MMKKVCKFLVILLIIGVVFNISIAPVKAEEPIGDPYIDITFDPIIKENKGHATIDLFSSVMVNNYNNSSITYGVDEYGTYMAWTSTASRGGGFNLNVDKAIGNDYTIALKFSFSNTGQYDHDWKKIIDFQKKSYQDSGFYFYNGGQIQFYPNASQGPYIKNNEVVDLLIRRDGDTNKFEVYNRIGDQSILCYEFIDVEELSVLSAGLGFFHDDVSTSSESSPAGKVYSIKIWDGYQDVDDVWEALDKEKDDSLSRYVCRKVEAQEPTDTLPGWLSYIECQSKDDDSYKYFIDDTYNNEIEDIIEYKKDIAYVPQKKSISEVVSILNERINNVNIDNVTSDHKVILEEIRDNISKFNFDKLANNEVSLLKELDEKCEALLEIINDTSNTLEEIKEVIINYTDKALTSEDIKVIKNAIIKTNNINDNHLNSEEKELKGLYLDTLDKILNGDNIYTYEVLNGDKQEFIQGEIDLYSFRIDGNFILFDSLYINGLTLVRENDYNVTEGSTIITFTKEGIKKLNTLAVGKYDISVNYLNSKKAIASLIINEKLKNPMTGDNIIIYVIIGTVSLIGIVGTTVFVKRKNNKNN